jgi:23S rRNA (adenine2030-N6)-methyltransferase
MLGSSVFVANPPHALFSTLQPVLPWLAQVLAQVDDAKSALEKSASA